MNNKLISMSTKAVSLTSMIQHNKVEIVENLIKTNNSFTKSARGF